jgi:hypothetical protein
LAGKIFLRLEVHMRRLPFAAAILVIACAGEKAAQKISAEPAPPGASAAAEAPTPGPDETVTQLDLGQHGRTDLWIFKHKSPDGKESVVRKERDLNGDGRVDAWEYFDADGNLSRQVYDMDFDGKPDVALYFEKSQLVRKEYGFGFDGKPHVWNFYEKNKLVRRERDANGDGKVDTWEYWENGEIDRIGVDLDGDGQVDKWESRKATAADAAPAAQK